MENKDNIDLHLNKILKESLYLDDKTIIRDDMYIDSIPEWDSLAQMMLINNIIDEFEIKINYADLIEIKNWKMLKKMVKNKIEGKKVNT